MPPIVNIAAYQFADLTRLPERRAALIELCKSQNLLGTILLSSEGINLFVAGTREGVDALLQHLLAIPELADLEAKESFSDDRPFNRMLVKIKREIIAFGVDGIDPRRHRSRRVSATELKRWLDEGRPVTLLDTRNNFEFEAGTFENAIAADVDDFRDFPAAVRRLSDDLKHQPIVTFCTGGIRCEKAAPYLEREGFTDVYQLEGGILKYLEDCGGAHYNGCCFVFDKRVALDASLKPSDLAQCFVCQAILSAEDQKSPHYVEGKSCPQCHVSETEAIETLIERRQRKIDEITTPLPGSVAYDHVRPISVPRRFDGLEVLDFLDAMRTHLSRDAWRTACAEGRLTCRDVPVLPGRILRSGERLFHKMPATREPDVSSDVRILYEDEAIVVVNKPAPLPTHPCGRFNRNSLSYILEQVYHPLRLKPAHRLDADTSGVLVFSKTRKVAEAVQGQFESGSVRKTYVARVYGHPADTEFECRSPISTKPGPRGMRLPDEEGAPSHTRFRVIERLDDGTALLEVEPLSGRTNQIRVHLWKLGFPIVGDPIYLRDGQLGAALIASPADGPMCLHAAALEFSHPLTGTRTLFEAPLPPWGLASASKASRPELTPSEC